LASGSGDLSRSGSETKCFEEADIKVDPVEMMLSDLISSQPAEPDASNGGLSESSSDSVDVKPPPIILRIKRIKVSY
jgi:hypothetical protein